MKLHRLSPLMLIAAAACSGGDGVDGTNYLTATETESAGSNCESGGLRLISGPDSNRNGELEESEIVTTNYVCNGANGEDGMDGTNGTDGGTAGQPLVITSPATPAQCAAGGVQIVSGIDANLDGDLSDPGEAMGQPQVLCNGSGGSLVAAATEPNGANCAAGGVRIQNGSDSNMNGVLEPTEVSGTTYACTDPTASNGSQPIVLSATRPPVQGEPDNTKYLANGTTGVLQTAAISVPAPGIVLAVATTSVYCDNSPESTATAGSEYNCAPAGSFTYANFTVDQQGTGGGMGTSGSYTRISLTPGNEVTMTTTEVFSVVAGTFTFRALGSPGVDGAGSAHIAYQLSDLTLLFIPN